MKGTLLLTLLSCFTLTIYGQKKPLDHTVYDGWQSIGERMISNDGRWVVYSINPQEGDNELVIQSPAGNYKKVIPRGYSAVITEDSRFVVFRIKPFFKDSRDARIKKKKVDEMPKDSIGIIELGKDTVLKVARIKSYKVPEKESGWVAYHLEKPVEKKDAARPGRESGDRKIVDSLGRVIDSLQHLLASIPQKKKRNRDDATGEPEDNDFAEGDETPGATADAGTDLVVRNITSGKEKTFTNVLDYLFSKKGSRLVIEQARNPRDTASRNSVLLYDLENDKTILLSKGGNEFKSFTFSEDGSQLAYLAERDARPKELQKYFKLWYYRAGMDSAKLLADKNTVGMKLGMTVSEYGIPSFSKSGRRLFFGTSPIQPPKDTTLVDIDLVKLDIWHYNDDYLQTTQLSRLQRDLQTNYLAVYNLDNASINQLASPELPLVMPSMEGDGERFVGVSDFGKRIEGQWAGNTKKDIYSINVVTGEKQLVKKDMLGIITPQYVSPTGNTILWYDSKARNYFAWDGDTIRNITKKLKVPLWNEEHDSPSDPPPYGVMGWHEKDSAVYIYDRYDVFRIDLVQGKNPVNISKGAGRKEKVTFRYIQLDPEKRYFKNGEELYFRSFDNVKKGSGIRYFSVDGNYYANIEPEKESKYMFGPITMSKDPAHGRHIIYTMENYIEPPNLYYAQVSEDPHDRLNNKTGNLRINLFEKKLSSLNPQQMNYTWGSAELYKWKAFDGKMAEGVLYKPEDFDPKKKYPLILYFYETHTNTLHDYMDPTPTGSRLNIPFFVSRGYLVFSPDIKYTIGHPAKSAYNYVVSAAKDLSKHAWVDGKNMGIQGQSWGGIQVAQLITMTDIFKAAWAGAPVANMTSAYGGIRWETGLNRQFQYEKTQSRIGATLWEKPQLYIENSPLFHLPKVKTPLVIMANDADGAVPWYQGIELFTGMRRLGKKVWLLNYNGEAHNLVERKNKKDIQQREQQFFDWLLKGEPPPRWITEGVPAVRKGRDWGLELVY